MANRRSANGPLETFGHEGRDGQWNPTLRALGVGIWTLVVGTPAARLRAYRRLDGIRRVRFHVAAWVLGMVIITPLWALIERQDNGGLERFAADDRPGSWEPWILDVGGIWAGVIVLIAFRLHLGVRRAAGTGTPD